MHRKMLLALLSPLRRAFLSDTETVSSTCHPRVCEEPFSAKVQACVILAYARNHYFLCCIWEEIYAVPDHCGLSFFPHRSLPTVYFLLVLSLRSSPKCWPRSCPSKLGRDARPTHLSNFRLITILHICISTRGAGWQIL